jgi:hypothetical protein
MQTMQIACSVRDKDHDPNLDKTNTMSTKEELTLRYKRAAEAYEHAKQRENEAIVARANAAKDRERAKERMQEHFMALENYVAKTETAKIGY